jgi:hypothetical protein
MDIDTSKWSGEGEFTQVLVDLLQRLDDIEFLRVEDAPSSRSEADYNFVANEVFVRFEVKTTYERGKRFGFLPSTRPVHHKAMTISQLEAVLTATPGVGPPDYADGQMLQYLRTERIVPPYQTRGYKLVELVRLYDAGSEATARRTAPVP